jgi:hypothetical protein
MVRYCLFFTVPYRTVPYGRLGFNYVPYGTGRVRLREHLQSTCTGQVRLRVQLEL